jgi:hypothetical protein
VDTREMTLVAHRPYPDRMAALVALSRALGYEGRAGGWVYGPSGRHVCQGWRAFVDGGHLTTAVDRLAPAELRHMPLADVYGGRWYLTDKALAAIERV